MTLNVFLRRLLLAVGLVCTSMGVQAGAYDDLIAAVYRDDTDTVIAFLSRGMDMNTVDPGGNTLLHTAARNGNLPLLDFLLKNRANPLVKNRVGDTALMIAVYNGKLDAAKRLLEGGAELNHVGWTPLHYAIFANQPEIARFLLEKGADVDARAPNQQTPLMIAARNGNLDLARLLLKANAKIELTDQHDETAAAIAAKANNTDIVVLLKQAAEPKPVVVEPPAKPVTEAVPAAQTKPTQPAAQSTEEYVSPPFQTAPAP